MIDPWMLAVMQQPENMPRLNVRALLAALALALPFVVGWLSGFCVFVVLWLAAAVVAGYKAGRGIDNDNAQ